MTQRTSEPEPGRGPLPEAEFRDIYGKVPRLTVELVVARDREALLTKRAGGPCHGLWHLPGGTVRFGEPLTEAVRRVARDEVGLTVLTAEPVGYLEYPSHYRNGLDDPRGVAFHVTVADGDVTLNDAASDYGWFRDLPSPMHDEQREFLRARTFGSG